MKKSLGAKPLVCPTPVYVVGTYDPEGRPNLMTVAWGGICCSQPPCMAVSVRKATYTYGNLMHSKAFTVNIPSVSQIREADFVGIYSGKSENMFEATGLMPIKSELVNAPMVAEFPMVAECKVIRTVEIGLHIQFIGEILDVKCDTEALDDIGRPDPERIEPFVFSPANRVYYSVGGPVGDAFSVGKKK